MDIRVRADAEEGVIAIGDKVKEREGWKEVVEGAYVKIEDGELELWQDEATDIVPKPAFDRRLRLDQSEGSVLSSDHPQRCRPLRP